MKKALLIKTLVFAGLCLGFVSQARAAEKKVKVFILAGQSNMEGYGMLGSLEHLGNHPKYGHLLKKLKNRDGSWATRDDVTVYWNKESKKKKHGPLSTDWGAMTGKSIGPELMFGTIMGQRYAEHVLLIKTAWGGKSVWADFRSPGAGEMTWDEKRVLKRDHWLKPSLFYRKMVAEINECLANMKDVVPGYKGQGYEIVGMAWFQGWNDYGEWHLQLDGKRVGMGLIERYPHNLAAMIRDLRKDLNAPDMPIVIGELGVGGHGMTKRAENPDHHEAVAMVKFRKAQKAVADDPSLKNVTFVPTAGFWDVRLQELRAISNAWWQEKQKKGIKDTEDNHLPTKELNDEFLRLGHHWDCHYNGSAATYCMIGHALAEALNARGSSGMSIGKEPAWRPIGGHLMTRWAKDVSPTKALPEYPRPMMKREHWKNLNGLWQYAIRPKNETRRPEKFDGHVLVPFCIESALSGVKKKVTEKDRIWYRRTFDVPGQWSGKRILLHFGAVDWETTVWVNGKEATHHRGGYDPFSVDVTRMLKAAGPQEIVLNVWDPTDKGRQARGKQQIIPEGFMYTPASGIWQTVWIEPVPSSYIRSVYTDADIDQNCAWVTVDTANTHDGYIIEARTLLPEPGQEAGSIPITVERKAGQRLRIRLRRRPETRLWSPETPFLYDLKVTLKDRAGNPVDTVKSYFGMRKISLGKDKRGVKRVFLNNKFVFQYGFLDQGWWPDGLYTAPTDEALRYDIETAKRVGCNMVRKHVKFEPQRFYYWCDRLGVIVWQDMPSAGNGSAEMKRQFELELKRMIDAARGHPSIVMWVAFNEGWGQYDAPRIAGWIKRYDPTRLVDHASGWADRGDFGDVRDIHIYHTPGVAPVLPNRAIVLGEFGGLGMAVKGHSWGDDRRWGEFGPQEAARLNRTYLEYIRALRPMIYMGLSGAVYTQITDIENELNGLMTYDRALLKTDSKQMAAAHRALYAPPPVVRTVLATSQQTPHTWRYTTKAPGKDWYGSGYDDSAWKKGPAGFGKYDTPTNIVPPRTRWTGSDIWIRRSFDLGDTKLVSPHFLIHHDEDAEVYINGQLAARLRHHNPFYTLVPLDKKTARTLKTKANCLAVHCRNRSGPQYIDVGIVDVLPAGRAAGQ